ncbi:Hypothetical protein, predicted transmembrane protein [Mycoplasmopsis bovigenitalium 51080]|uniref:Uncharacterized protein n=1 Tax=Mycoplasmopsis bovigenitalium 51080 TaxID=1188235 RepID=N9TVG7_9BACT|nr:hypothetical protein [Mycoplasmopsis bovigenitalium]ENY70129.1 Hypothetical protein, predicted transmembrane protein [Mycoplasmopsis bovigenitalium 51080]
MNEKYNIEYKIHSGSIIDKLKEEKYSESSKNIIKTIELLERYILAKMNIVFKNSDVSWDVVNYLVSSYHRYLFFIDQLNKIIDIDNNKIVSEVDAYFGQLGIGNQDELDDQYVSFFMWYKWHSLFSESIKPLLEVKAAHDQVVTENTTLKDENQNLKGDATKIKAENTALKTDNLSLKDEVAKLKVENQNIKDAAAKLKAENDDLKTENNQSKNDKESLQTKFDKLTKNHNKLLADNKKDKNKIFIFIVLLLLINIILWVIIALIIFKKSYKSKSRI